MFKECSSCGALYTTNYCCSKGGLADKIVRDPNKTPDSSQRPPQNCIRCGNPVDGPYCRGCALLRKKFKEDLFTYCVENGIFQDLQDTSESSNDNTNVVNAPQEPFVVKQDPGENSSQSPPHIDHNCCYECGDSLDGIFCQRCTCKSCGKGAHHGYNCPPKVPIISNPGPCNNQTIDELPQTLPRFDLTCYSERENSLPYVSKPNFVDDSPNVFNPPPQPPTFDQFQPPHYTTNHPIFNAQNELFNSQNKLMEQLTSVCDMVGQYIQKKEEEKRIEEEQAAKARYWKILVCYDDDDDEERSIPLKDTIISGLPPCVAITPALSTEEPVDSLIMENEHLDTIPEMNRNLSNLLFDANDDFSSSDDESFSDEDVPNEIYSNPLFDEEIISVKIDASIISMIDSLLEQFSGELAHNDLIPPGINEADFDLEDFPDCKDSRARGFVLHSRRSFTVQLHFGIQYLTLSSYVYLYQIFTKGQNRSQTRQNRERNWIEREKQKPKVQKD
ncbi:hypothetical protein Tco_0612702 [Tanacetum coccineum]